MGMTANSGDLNALVHVFEEQSAGITARTALVVRKVGFGVERDTKIGTPVDTGNLKNSWRTEEVANSARELSVIVGTDVDYAPFVENGTSRMAPRRPLGHAVDRWAPQFAAAMAKLAELPR